MDNLPSDVRSLLHRTRQQDGPTSRDKERIGQKLSLALAAAGGAAGVVATKSAVAATALVAGEAATTSATIAAAGAATGEATLASTTAAVASGAGVVGVGAGKAAVAPVVAVASKWGGSTLAAWLVGASVVGAGAISAPRVVHWVNEGSRPHVATQDESLPVQAVQQPVQRPPAAARVEASVESKNPGENPVAIVEPSDAPPAKVVLDRSSDAFVTPKVETPSAAVSARNERGASDPGAEVALLSQAQGALANGDANRSLFLLREHAKHFPSSALSAERSAARVFAYCQLGRVQDAQAAARAFFRNGVSSPLTPKVQASCINASDSKNSSTNPESAGN